MNYLRQLLWVAALVAVSLPLACGGDDDDSPSAHDDSPSTGGETATPENDGGAGGAASGGTAPGGEYEEVGLQPSEEGNWIASESNPLGLQGAWYVFADPGGSVIEFTDGEAGQLCVAGVGALVEKDESGAPQWRTYWGAGLGWDVCNTGEAGDPPDTKYGLAACPFGEDLDDRIIGVRFHIEASLASVDVGAGGAGGASAMEVEGIPPELRLQFAETNRNESTYEIVPQQDGEVTVLFEDAKVLYNPGAPPIAAELVESVQFQIATSDRMETPFAFCVSDFRVLTN